MMANPALLLVDIQDGFDAPKWGRRNNPQAETVAAHLLSTWRENEWPVFYVRHDSPETDCPLNPSSPGNNIKTIVHPLPGEPVIGKTVSSAFIGTDLHERLSDSGIKRVIIVRLTTPHCVSTTARMAGNLGYETYVATAAFGWTAHDGRLVPAEEIHYHTLAALHGEFATIMDSRRLREIATTW